MDRNAFLRHVNNTMARRASARRAMTLLELAAVVFIVGLLGAVAVTRYGGSAVADAGAQGFAQRVALDFLQARARTISTGDNHCLRFVLSGGEASQYALYRDAGGSDVLVDDIRVVPGDVAVTTGGTTDAEFAFSGEALSSYTITIAGPDRTWTVTVPQVTGKPFLQEL